MTKCKICSHVINEIPQLCLLLDDAMWSKHHIFSNTCLYNVNIQNLQLYYYCTYYTHSHHVAFNTNCYHWFLRNLVKCIHLKAKITVWGQRITASWPLTLTVTSDPPWISRHPQDTHLGSGSRSRCHTQSGYGYATPSHPSHGRTAPAHRRGWWGWSAGWSRWLAASAACW